MRSKYKPEPVLGSSSRVAIAHRDACWLVSAFRDNDGRTTWLSRNTHPWTAAGERAARAEFARLTDVASVTA